MANDNQLHFQNQKENHRAKIFFLCPFVVASVCSVVTMALFDIWNRTFFHSFWLISHSKEALICCHLASLVAQTDYYPDLALDCLTKILVFYFVAVAVA